MDLKKTNSLISFGQMRTNEDHPTFVHLYKGNKVFAECETNAAANKILEWKKAFDYFTQPPGLDPCLSEGVQAERCQLGEWYCFLETGPRGLVTKTWHKAIAFSKGQPTFVSWYRGCAISVVAEADRVVYPPVPIKTKDKKFRPVKKAK